MKNVTQNDVAREAGVTRSMVSYVISGNSERTVAPETRERILAAIQKLGYRPNKAAQALQQGDVAFAAKKIGVVLCSSEVLKRPYYAEILAGIHTSAHENNYHVSFIRFFDELKDPVLFNDLIHQEEIGGLILVATELFLKTPEDFSIIQQIKQRIKKTVCVEWKYDGLSSVLFDRRDAAIKAAEYLFTQGYETIAYFGQNDDRVLGVQNVISRHGKDSSMGKIYLGQCTTMTDAYNSCVDYVRTGGDLPRALVCGSDEVAVGVMCALNENRIAVPDQVAVISIDNLEIAGYTNPPLTTVNVQKNAMGSRAVEMIVNDQVGQDENAVCITLPTNIVVRKSS